MPDNQCLSIWHINRFRTIKTLPEYISVYLQNEIPRFGCGWRRLFILSHDSEWTVLLNPASAKAARISSSTLHNLRPRTLLPEVDYSTLFLSSRLKDIAGKIVNTFTHKKDPPETGSYFEDAEFKLLECAKDYDDEDDLFIDDDEDDLDVRQLLARLIEISR